MQEIFSNNFQIYSQHFEVKTKILMTTTSICKQPGREAQLFSVILKVSNES